MPHAGMPFQQSKKRIPSGLDKCLITRESTTQLRLLKPRLPPWISSKPRPQNVNNEGWVNYPPRNDHIPHLGKFAKSSTQKCRLKRGHVIVPKEGIPTSQIIILHQARFPWTKGISLPQLHFGGPRSHEVAIVWPASILSCKWDFLTMNPTHSGEGFGFLGINDITW